MEGECLETQRTACRRFLSVFEIPSIPNIGQYLRFHRSQILVSIWDSIDPKYWSVFEIDGNPYTGVFWNKCGINSLFGVSGSKVCLETQTQNISPIYVSFRDFVDPKSWSVFGFTGFPNTGIIKNKYGIISLFGIIWLRAFWNIMRGISPK